MSNESVITDIKEESEEIKQEGNPTQSQSAAAVTNNSKKRGRQAIKLEEDVDMNNLSEEMKRKIMIRNQNRLAQSRKRERETKERETLIKKQEENETTIRALAEIIEIKSAQNNQLQKTASQLDQVIVLLLKKFKLNPDIEFKKLLKIISSSTIVIEPPVVKMQS